MASILVVDDDTATRVTVARVIERMGHEVVQAGDGAAALAILSECKFDLVVLDVMMPVLDGPSTLARMREGGDRTPVILLTAESSRALVAGALKRALVDYIKKPFGLEELRRKVREAICA